MFHQLYEWIRQRLHVPPGLVVLLVVLVLLYDVSGAVAVAWDMVVSLLASLVGGGDHDAVTGVLWRTLPLALAAAGVTFAVCSRWLELDSFASYTWIALIVLAAATVGNACYEQLAPRPVAVVADTPQLPNQPPTSLARSLKLPQHVNVAVVPAPSTVGQRLAAIEWLKKPDLSRPPQPVKPLHLIPKGPGILGAVAGAINQLLGYLVDYEPRLFLASIVAGSFVGWRLHRRVVVAHAVVSGDLSELTERETKKLAA